MRPKSLEPTLHGMGPSAVTVVIVRCGAPWRSGRLSSNVGRIDRARTLLP